MNYSFISFRPSRWVRWCALVWLAALAIPRVSLAAPTSEPMVIIISIDGMAGFYLDDPKAELPTLRKLAAEGASASSMKAVLPTSTWANHTTLVTGVPTGRHGVIANRFWDREKAKVIPLLPDPILNKEEIVRVPTIYDVAHQSGLKTLAVLWPATRGAHTLDWTFPDVATDKQTVEFGTPSLLQECRAAGLPVDQHQHLRDSNDGPGRDRLYTQILLLQLKLHHPQLTLLHLVNVDHEEHEFGPRSPQAYEALHLADQRVGEIISALQADFPGQATVIVTSDHGFASSQQSIQPNVKFRQAGWLTLEKGKVKDRQVYSLSEGGSAYIYVLAKTNRTQLIKQAAAMFKGVEGIDEIITPNRFRQFGLALPKVDPHMADLILTSENGYSFSDEANGDIIVTAKSKKVRGVHGHSPLLPDLHATFIAWGKGIKPGVKMKEINNLDVAPTAATLLGIKMKTEGRVLREIIQK